MKNWVIISGVRVGSCKGLVDKWRFQKSPTICHSEGAKRPKNLKITRSFASLRMTKRDFVSSSKYLFRGEANFFPLATTRNFLTGHCWVIIPNDHRGLKAGLRRRLFPTAPDCGVVLLVRPGRSRPLGSCRGPFMLPGNLSITIGEGPGGRFFMPNCFPRAIFCSPRLYRESPS
jgi:hypothetical protein